MSAETLPGKSAKPSPSDLQRQMANNAVTANYQQGEDPRVRKVRRIISQFSPGKKILDVGCADGEIIRPFAKTHKLYAVDICHDLLLRAEQHGIKTRLHDVASDPLPYADGEFDVVFSGETIEHQVDTDWFLAELNRVLKLNGDLVLTMPNVRTVASLAAMIFLDVPPIFSARYRSGHSERNANPKVKTGKGAPCGVASVLRGVTLCRGIPSVSLRGEAPCWMRPENLRVRFRLQPAIMRYPVRRRMMRYVEQPRDRLQRITRRRADSRRPGQLEGPRDVPQRASAGDRRRSVRELRQKAHFSGSPVAKRGLTV